MEMEIKALLVDDEEQCVKTLQDGIDWKVLGVAETFGAYNAVQAREIMKEEMISLILCDIEMPGESGLEFISSVREKADLNDENIECIILTCYPDYKFMTTLYSDRYLPKVGELSNNLRNFDRDRMLLFDEKKVFDMLIREGLFEQYSNSFLVMTGPMTDIVYSRFSNDRAEHLSIRTDILEKDGKHTVRKYPATSAAAAHIEALAENECVFTERFKDSTLSVNRLELKRNPDGLPFAEIEYLENSRTLEELLDECLQNNDEAGFDKLFDRYCKIAAWKAEGTKQDYDLTFPNICVQGDIWTMIDYEWTTDKLTPQQIISRALNCYGQEDPVRMEHPIVKKHLEALGIGKEQMRELSEKELAFQHFVLQEKDGRSRTALGQLRHLIGNRAVPYQEFFARADRKKVQVFEDFGAGYTPEHSYYQYDAYEADDLINARITCKAGTKAIRCGAAVSGTDSWNRMARKSADAGTAGSVPVDERTDACRYPGPCSDGTV